MPVELSSECELVLSLVELSGKIERRLGGALSFHGLGVSEFMVLRQLYKAPSKTMRRVDLSAAIGMTASGITRLLNPMEKIGLVQKEPSPRDARVSLVSLSSAGARMLDEIDTALNESARSLVDPLSAADIRRFHTLVHSVA